MNVQTPYSSFWPNQPIGALGKLNGTTWKWVETCDGGPDPSNACYNWSALDKEVAQAQAAGLSIIYSFDGVPSWAGPAPNMAPSSWTYLSDFATAIATRYKGQIQYYEEYNEPDSNGEWNDTYANLVQYAMTVYQAVKAVDPNAQVGAPCPAIQVYQPSSSPTTGALDFVGWMRGYFQAGGNQYADFAGWHAYACQVGEYGCNGTIGCDKASGNIIDCASGVIYNQYDQYRAMLSSVGLGNVPLLDSESGWGKDDGDSFCPNYDTTACFASVLLEPAYVSRLYVFMASTGANGTAGVQTAYWYNWGSSGSFDNGGWGTLNGSDGQNPAAGLAYGQVYSWLLGSTFTGRCSASGTVWSCPLVQASGIPALIVWDASLSCSNSSCGTSTYTVPSGYTQYLDLTGTCYAISGGTIQISASPVLISTGPSFRAVPGKLQQVSVGSGGSVWGINSSGSAYVFNTQTEGWQYAINQLSQIAVAGNGFEWGLNASGNIYVLGPNTEGWEQVPGTLAQIAVGSDGDAWGLNSQGAIYHFNSSAQTWDGIPGSLAQVAVGSDGAVWGLNAASEIYRFDPGTQLFEQVRGSLTQIAVGDDGDAWGINSASQIYHFDFLTQRWDEIAGGLRRISVGSATSVWGLNESGGIYNFDVETQSWKEIPGSLKQISAGANGAVWGVNNSGNTYELTGPKQPVQTFVQVPGALAQLAVASDGNVWGINGAGQIYTFNALTQNWTWIPGSLSEISIGRGGNVWGLNRAGTIYTFNAATQNWTSIPGQLYDIAVGGNGDVWGINTAGEIYRFNKTMQGWTWIPGALSQISVGEDGTVWGINSAQEIYRFNSSAQNWDWIPGWLAEISVGSQENVWGINAAGQIYRFDLSTRSWDWIPGSLAQIAVAFDGSVWGVNSSGQVWTYDSQTQSWMEIPGLLTAIAVGADAVVWGIGPANQIYAFK